jgi:type I restriction enzyme, S subunit
MRELPRGWAEVTFEDVADVNPKKAVDLSPGDLVTFVPMAAVDAVSGTVVNPTDRPLKEVDKGFRQFAENDVIFAKITPSMENGKSAVATGLTNRIGFGSTEFHVFRSYGAVLPEFLWHFVRQQEFRDKAQEVMSGAVGQQRVPVDYLKARPLPLPPLPEQKRIVAKIDSLTASTSRARTHLARIPALVEKQRIAVLCAAFEGRLSSSSKFQEVAEPTKAASPRQGLWKTPKHWVWMRADETGRVNLGRQRSPKNHHGPDMRPYIRSANITWRGIDTSDIKQMNFDSRDFERFRLEYGDVLLNEGSGSAKEVGKPAIWRDEIPYCCYQNTVLRVQPRLCSPEYLQFYFLYTAQTGRFISSTQGVNIQHISKDGLARYLVPVPPRD